MSLLAGGAPTLLPGIVRRLLLLFLFALLSVAALRAATVASAGVKVTGARSSSNLSTGETVYSGDATQRARLEDSDLLLLADEIRYAPSSGVAIAIGNVGLARGPLHLLADKITYFATTRVYSVIGPRFTLRSLNVTGTTSEGTAEAITVRDAQIVLTEPGPWAPALRASTATFDLTSRTLHTTGARLGLGRLELFSLPVSNLPFGDPLLPDLSLRAGFRSNLGAYLDIGLVAPVRPSVSLGGDLGFYSQRGLLFGPAFEIKVDRPGLVMTDTLRSGYINDYGNRKTDVLARPISSDRGFVEWRHYEEIGDSLSVFGQLSYWTDSEVIRDFRPEKFYPVQVPDTFLEADYANNNSITSLFLRAQPNKFFEMQRRLPELRYDQLPTAIGFGLYESFAASAAVLQEGTLPAGSGSTVTSKRLDTVLELTRPYAPREWFSIRPVVGARFTYYADATGGRSTYTRATGEIGADAELHASATYDYVNAVQGINGLRHLVTPTLAYRYLPDATHGAAFIPAIDDAAFSTYLPPLGLTAARDTDRPTATNVLRLGLNNTLQTRDTQYGSRDLGLLNFAIDWRLDRVGAQRPFSAVQTEFAAMPAPWLRVDTFSRVDPRTAALREFNTGVTIRDSDAWFARLGSHFLQHQLQEYVLDAGWRLDEARELLARFHYDARLSRLIEQDYGLRQNFGNLWLVRYLIVLYQGPRRESSFGFNLEIQMRRW